jgi:hypothetical protein
MFIKSEINIDEEIEFPNYLVQIDSIINNVRKKKFFKKRKQVIHL